MLPKVRALEVIQDAESALGGKKGKKAEKALRQNLYSENCAVNWGGWKGQRLNTGFGRFFGLLSFSRYCCAPGNMMKRMCRCLFF